MIGDPGQQRWNASEAESVRDLLGNLSRDMSDLIRQELQLAKAEMRTAAKQAGLGAGMLGGASVAGFFGLFFISIAVWWAIGNSTGRGWSALIVAAIWIVIASALAVIGLSQLHHVTEMPYTADTTRRIPDVIRGNKGQHR